MPRRQYNAWGFRHSNRDTAPGARHWQPEVTDMILVARIADDGLSFRDGLFVEFGRDEDGDWWASLTVHQMSFTALAAPGLVAALMAHPTHGDLAPTDLVRLLHDAGMHDMATPWGRRA